MIECQKHLFDIPDDVTWLNCGSYTPLLKSVKEAGDKGLDRKFHPWDMTLSEVPAEADLARALFARLIGAEPEDIAITPSTAYGAATAARNLPIAAGQRIVVLADQFPSNVYAWRHLAAENGADIHTVPWPDDGNWTQAVLDAINADTGIAALPPCHWTDGSRVDLVAVGARCREVGAALFVDATQAVGALPFDVTEVQPDFLACSAYKWLCCPYTLAFLYAAPHCQDGTPLEFHRWNHGTPAANVTTTGYDTDLAPGAARFDMGERNNFINMPMTVKALTQVLDWRPDRIQATLGAMTGKAAEEAEARGWQAWPAANRVGHYIGLRPPIGVPDGLSDALAAERIYVSQRGPCLRVSPHLHSTPEDIERLFKVVDQATR